VGVIIVLLSVYLIRQGIMAPAGAPYDADVSSTPEDASPSDSQTTGAGGKPGADSAEQPALPPLSPPSDTVQPASEEEEEEESASASPAEVVPTTVGQVLAGLAAPAVGEVIRPFGFYQSVTFQDWRYHSGVDIALTTGDQVRAAASGTVTRVEGTRLEGWRVVISHGLGVTTIYGQMTATTVNEGESVSGGEPIGLAGAPGSLEADLGPHLHYEIRVQDRATDPTPYLGP
jgi:murein DD-endopeptidase MepM/ murein hydrolase activator NlpD